MTSTPDHSFPSTVKLPSFTKTRAPVTSEPDPTPPPALQDLPNLRTIDHPGVRRIGPDAFIFYDPTKGLSPTSIHEALSAQTIIAYCNHDKLVRGLADPTRRALSHPLGYDHMTALFNTHAVGQRRFATWDDINNTYQIAGSPLSPADFGIKTERTQPARRRRHPHYKQNNLVQDMLRVAAANETARQMSGNKYFNNRFRKRADKFRAQGGSTTTGKPKNHHKTATHHTYDQMIFDIDEDQPMDENIPIPSTSSTST